MPKSPRPGQHNWKQISKFSTLRQRKLMNKKWLSMQKIIDAKNIRSPSSFHSICTSIDWKYAWPVLMEATKDSFNLLWNRSEMISFGFRTKTSLTPRNFWIFTRWQMAHYQTCLSFKMATVSYTLSWGHREQLNPYPGDRPHNQIPVGNPHRTLPFDRCIT